MTNLVLLKSAKGNRWVPAEDIELVICADGRLKAITPFGTCTETLLGQEDVDLARKELRRD